MRPCSGLVCAIGLVTGRGCDGNAKCPLAVLHERGEIAYMTPPAAGIDPSKWAECSGGYVQDETDQLWQIVGFIDRPAIILRSQKSGEQHVEIMGSNTASRFRLLVPGQSL